MYIFWWKNTKWKVLLLQLYGILQNYKDSKKNDGCKISRGGKGDEYVEYRCLEWLNYSLCDIVIIEILHHAFVKTQRTYNTEWNLM